MHCAQGTKDISQSDDENIATTRCSFFFLRIHQTVSQLAAVAPCQLPIVGGLVVPLVLRRGEGDALLAGEVHAEPLLGDRPARLVVVVLHGEVGSRPARRR